MTNWTPGNKPEKPGLYIATTKAGEIMRLFWGEPAMSKFEYREWKTDVVAYQLAPEPYKPPVDEVTDIELRTIVAGIQTARCGGSFIPDNDVICVIRDYYRKKDGNSLKEALSALRDLASEANALLEHDANTFISTTKAREILEKYDAK